MELDKIKMKLKEFLEQKGLVVAVPTPEEIIERIEKIKPRKLKILYGETYDKFGEPIDSLKHYFFVANLSKVLEDLGIPTEPTILIANTAVCRNEPVENHSNVMEYGNKRADLLKKINSIYKTGLNILFMDEFIHTKQFEKKVDEIREKCFGDYELMEMLEKTVPGDKVDIEKKKGFQYSLEEIATILDFDIKIGPPREKFYDELANKIAKSINKNDLLPIYLTPSYPIGLKFDFFLANPEIEEYGITAYKAGSKGLQNNRIIIGKTNKNDLKKLIENTFISKNPLLPNPIVDLCIIAEMAEQRFKNQIKPIETYKDFYEDKLGVEALKERTVEKVEDFILSKLKDY